MQPETTAITRQKKRCAKGNKLMNMSLDVVVVVVVVVVVSKR